MTDQQLPAPIETDLPGWETALAEALGYTFPPEPGRRMPDGSTPTAWHLSLPPFSLVEDTREVIAWEVDAEPDETGFRRARVDPIRPSMILVKPVRYPLPDGFDFVTIVDVDGPRHRVVLRSAC